MAFKDWIPVVSKLVWPFLVVIGLLVFKGQVSEIYTLVVDAIKAGRSVQLGGLLTLGERANATSITDLSRPSMPIEALAGTGPPVVRKGSSEFLEQLKERLRESPHERMDVLLIVEHQTYWTELLEKYVSSLGVQFIVFQKQGKFEGWTDAGFFTGQLWRKTYSYDQLIDEIVGINRKSVRPEDSTREVLERMQAERLESIAVVDADGKFQFMVKKSDVLAKLMISVVVGQ